MVKIVKLSSLNIIIIIMSFLIVLPIFSYNWTEKTKQDFEDGYFYRSTVTADGKLQVRQWDDWWNTSWSQRIPIEINTTGINDTLYDYQIWFITNTKALVDAGKLDSQGTAIRIAGSDGKTLIPFWIENWNITTSTGSKIWVKVPQIPPNTKSYIYMYVKNVSTNSLSNRDAVFDLYEDWETGQIRTQTPWSDTGWITIGDESSRFEIHTSTDQLYNYTTYSTGTVNVYEGNYCVRSGTVPHSGSIYLQTTINLTYPARIEFYWACYSEGGYDWLRFYIGAAKQAEISGNKSWEFRTISLPSGVNTFSWKFERDSTGDGYYNRGFVDKVIVRKYNSILETQLQQRVVVQQTEEWSTYYKYAEYWSNVFDTHAENTDFTYSSWTQIYNPAEHTVEVYIRGSNDYFTLLSTFPSFTPNPVPNNSNPSGMIGRCRYIQYRIIIKTFGNTTPEVGDVNFTYFPLPLRPYNFDGVAISSTTIIWSWTPRATYYPAIEYIDGYRIYSATRTYNKDGGYLVITSTSEGLLAELPPDATYWVEENLQPNTLYQRYVVAYTTTVVTFGGNASRNILGGDTPRGVYTLALHPHVVAERYETTGFPPYYRFVEISTQVWYVTKEFSFTSGLSTGTGTLAYYRYIFTTTTTWNDIESSVWYPSSQTYTTGGGEEIIERPKLDLIATQNSDNWYFQVKSYNYDHRESGYQILGPFWFKGCPAQITDLVATRGKGEEGNVVLSWTAPTDDMDSGDLTNAKFVIKYRLAGIIDTESKFDSVYPILTSTGMVQGVIEISTNVIAGIKQTYIVTGLVPGLTYWFAIRTIDNNQNKSVVSTHINPATGMIDITKLRAVSSKIARIEFVTPSYTFYAGDVSPQMEVKLVDDEGDEIKTKFGGECNLLTTSNKGSFSIDGVNFGISKLNILPNTSRGKFYYMDENSGSPLITIDEVAALQQWNGEQGWQFASQNHTVLPGKAVTFRVVPQDGNYNCQIVVDKPVYVEAVDKLGNRAVDFEGVVVATTSFQGMLIEPSNITFTLADQGRVSAVLRNYFYAGASSVTILEVVSQDYKKMLFTDYYNGYVVGSKGMLKSTAEGGLRWFTKIYRNNSQNGLNSIAVEVDNNISLLCGKNGLVIRSTDSFVSFIEQNISSNDLNDIVFVDSSTVIVCGNNGVIMKSSTSGESFTSITSPVTENLNSIVFISTSVGFICGNNGKLLKTVDKGATFTEINTGVSNNLYRIKFVDEQTGFICGHNSIVLKTEDSGNNFATVLVSTENITIYDVDFITPQIGVVCGSNGKVFISTNSGDNFTDISPKDVNETFYTIKMFDLNKILVAGSNGSMYFTPDRGTTWQKVVMQGKSPQDYLWNATIISSFETKTNRIVQGRTNQTVATIGLKLAYPTAITTRINKIVVHKLGSLPDEYITAVKVKDYGQGSFVNNVAEILLPSQPIIRYTTSYFDIQVDISPEAPLDTTFALRFDFGCVNVAVGVQFGRNNLPYITYRDTTTLEYLTVVPPVVNVYIIDIDTSAYLRTYTGFEKTKVLEQGDSAIVAKFALITDRSISPFRKLRVNLSGTNIRDEDIKVVKLYSEIPFDENNLISSATFSGSIAFLDFVKEQIISDKVTNYYYLTVEISPEASYSRDLTEVNFSFRIDISTSYFLLDVEGVNTISSKLVYLQGTINTTSIRVEVSKDIVYVRLLPEIVARIPEKVYQSERVVLLPLGISVGKRGLGIASADWSRLRIDKSTYAADGYTRFDRSSWTVVEVWHDENGNGSLEFLYDRKLGEARFENNTAVVIFSQPEKIDKQEYLSEYATYFVCCYIPKNATPDEKLKLFLSTGTYFTLGGVDIVESNNFPIISPEVKIADWPDEVETELLSLSPQEAALYEKDVLVARIDFLAFCDATLDKLIITHEGTSEASSTVKLVKIYLDDGDLRFDNTKDIVVATGTFDATNKCELIFFNPQNQLKYKPILILDEKVRAFLTFDFNENATPDKTIGVGIDPTGFTYNLPNRQKPFGYFSTSKIMLLDRRTPTKPVIIPSVPLGYGIDTGKEIENKIFYTPHSNELKFNWYSEAPYGGGIKTGYAGISSRKPFSINDTPEILRYITVQSVGDFTLTGLNLEHNKLYYLWIKSESNANFARVNYVPIFVDNTPPDVSYTPVTTLPSNGVFWLNCNIKDDNESFAYMVEIQERIHQEYLWNTFANVDLKIYDVIKDIYFDKFQKVVKGSQIIFSSRNIVSDDLVIEYNFVVSPKDKKEDVEVVNFDTLFSLLGYKLENSSIKISYRIGDKKDNKMYYYRVRTTNVVKLSSLPSESSKAVYLSLPYNTIVELTTFPNPCDVRKKTLYISYVLSEDAEVIIKIFDLFGNLVYEKKFPYGDVRTKQGTHFVECEQAKNFPAGMYILVLETKTNKGRIEYKRWKLGIIK